MGPGTLAEEAVAPFLGGRFGAPYLYERECESTQALLLDSGLPEGAVAVTEHQTGGRGRHGRRWVAPPGTSVLASILLRPPPDRPVPELSLVAALAVAEAIDGATGTSSQVKWPNDVMLEERKVAGILAELRGSTVVVGIGVNVNQSDADLPSDAPTAPGSLRAITDAVHDRAALLGSVLVRLEDRYETWRADGLAALHGEIEVRDFLRDRRVSVDGSEVTARRILPDGRLEIETDGGELLSLHSGEVILGRA